MTSTTYDTLLQDTTSKPPLSFGQIFNMSFGFFGIQFGWDLQRANMGPIYEYLDASPEQIPILFLAAPFTGLVVQPIIGYFSDKTWHPRWGRRRPYFFFGAIFSTLALFLMPNSSALWMAAGLLWILDTACNVAMEPFRAFVADKLPEEQRTRGFAMQSLMIGLGGSIASALPWIMSNIFNVSNQVQSGQIPPSVKYAFYVGASIFLVSVLYTVFTTKEYPPRNLKDGSAEPEQEFKNIFHEITYCIRHMPVKMRQLALVQMFTWPGLFLMWFYYSTAVARNVFNAADENDPLYTQGVEFAGLTLSFYNIVAFIFALSLPLMALKLGRKITHSICLLCGAIGMIAVGWVENRYMLYACMTGVGIAWASILSMPYAMLAGSLPENRVGIYMGIFNFFIVLPEIIASLFFGWIMEHLLGNSRMLAVQVGGALMIVAAIICYLYVKEKKYSRAIN